MKNQHTFGVPPLTHRLNCFRKIPMFILLLGLRMETWDQLVKKKKKNMVKKFPVNCVPKIKIIQKSEQTSNYDNQWDVSV